jgi:hypothetical protein
VVPESEEDERLSVFREFVNSLDIDPPADEATDEAPPDDRRPD